MRVAAAKRPERRCRLPGVAGTVRVAQQALGNDGIKRVAGLGERTKAIGLQHLSPHVDAVPWGIAGPENRR